MRSFTVVKSDGPNPLLCWQIHQCILQGTTVAAALPEDTTSTVLHSLATEDRIGLLDPYKTDNRIEHCAGPAQCQCSTPYARAGVLQMYHNAPIAAWASAQTCADSVGPEAGFMLCIPGRFAPAKLGLCRKVGRAEGRRNGAGEEGWPLGRPAQGGILS